MIITQEGTPVVEKPEEREEHYEGAEAVQEMAKEIRKGLLNFKNSAIFKIGVVAVAIKVVGVAGQIIIENQRLKSEERRLAGEVVKSFKREQDDEQ